MRYNKIFTLFSALLLFSTAVFAQTYSGTISETVTLTDGANITLNNATITSGIVCEGSATITLVGTNSVSGSTFKAGIEIGGSGTTLTIKGDGSLTANGYSQSAGIGLSRAWDPANDVIGGDIVIEGGNITANGGSQWGAGIGTGVIYGNGSAKTVRIGNITIKGGTVKATGGSDADGIGTGYTYNLCTNAIGTVTIYDGIDLVDASSIKDFGSVVYMHGETDVTDSKANYFTIAEDGDRRIIMQKDDTDYNVTIDADITGGTVTADKTTAKAGEFVTLTITPATGYGLQSLTVKDASDNDVSLSNRKFIMPKGGVTVSATFIQTTAAFYQGVLTLNGNVVADEVKAYGAVIDDIGGIDEYSPVTSVVCEPGTVLPADCSELFLNFYNTSDNLTIDLSNADVSGVTNMSKMFGSSCVKTIYVNSAWSMGNVTSSDLMFSLCPYLVGGDGTMWEDVEYSYYESNGGDWEAADVEASSSTYAIIDGKDGKEGYLTHKKGTPVITTAPSAKTNLVYNGEGQELITAGTTNFGDLLSYSLDGVNYSTEIPTATDAGTYTVYYKVENSDNWNEVDAKNITVSITKATPTFTAPEKQTINCQQTLANVTLSDGYRLVNAEQTLAIGDNTVALIYNPDENNYENATGNMTVVVEHKSVVTDEAVAATCTEDGKTEGSHCEACHTVIVAQEVEEATGHLFTNYVYNNDATKLADGTETAVCDHGCGTTDTRTAVGTMLPGTVTTVNEVDAEKQHAKKYIENGTLIIEVNGVKYDVTGRVVK
ncbi:MAG: hypothetical protein E7069_10685 [Bacteroidales bacterium]|jgi:hypothetical protein|nr:hypothetical protein [Bacteroidales bacterium]